VGRSLGVACAIDGLTRVRETAPQPGSVGANAKRNLEGAIDCQLALEGKHVVLSTT
jgi:predicted amidophosphoribosyltransferase